MGLSLLAPAKVNLFLHVGPLAGDGYHPLSSLMSFADIGDRLTLEPAGTSGLDIVGPFASALAQEDPAANLAWRAVQALLSRVDASPPPFRLRLEKTLPVASGLGGGSSDAGAALRLVRAAFAPDVGDAVLEAIAAELGADGPACLAARPVVAQGRGERLSPAPAMPSLPAVLVNPGVPCSTASVYRAYDAAPRPGGEDLPALPPRFETVVDAIAFMARCRNDLQAPALAVSPAIRPVLDRLASAPEARLARVSGSGATCFALFEDTASAEALAQRLTHEQPQWWVQACRLGDAGAPPGVHETVIMETDPA